MTTDYFADIEHDLGATGRKSATLVTEVCIQCGGSGKFRSYTGRIVGDCYSCKGAGKRSYKQPYAVRQAARVSAQRTKERKAASWNDAHPEEAAWIADRAPRFGFAASMREAVVKYGHLTDNQLLAVQRLMAKDAERDAARAAERAQRIAAAPVVDIAPIVAAFGAALDSGLAAPKLRVAEFRFSPAKAHSANAGAIYVKSAAGDYLGKLMDGKFHASRDCSGDVSARILAVAADPKNAAISFGKQFGQCACCGRELSDPVSVERGIGPICADKWGW